MEPEYTPTNSYFLAFSFRVTVTSEMVAETVAPPLYQRIMTALSAMGGLWPVAVSVFGLLFVLSYYPKDPATTREFGLTMRLVGNVTEGTDDELPADSLEMEDQGTRKSFFSLCGTREDVGELDDEDSEEDENLA